MSKTDSPPLWKPLAVITGLAAVAFVAPVLDIYGNSPEVFVANRTSATELFVFASVVGLIIPVFAWLALAVAGLFGNGARETTYRVIVGLLAIATGLVVSRQLVPDNTWLAVATAVGVAGLIYWLTRVIDTVFVFAALATPLLMIVFVATSATADLIWTETEPNSIGVTVDSPQHLVIIQLDEMPLASIMRPDGTVNDELFPGFARLAESGTWYRNALSDSIATTQSVPAILTGIRGEKDMAPTYVDYPNSLFSMLDGTHEMHVIEWVAELCPEEICPEYAGRAPARFGNLLADVGVVYGHLTLPGETREALPSIANAWKGFLGQTDQVRGDGVEIDDLPVPPDGERPDWIDWVQRLMNGIKSGTQPTLSYAHLQTPHVPWEANPSGTHYQRPEEYTEVFGVEGDGRWALDPEPVLLGFQRHLYQVGFFDQMLVRLLDHIDESGTWDDTMIVVVADHGASFTPGEHRRWPFEDNRDDLYRVPLFIKYPNQTEGSTVDLPAFGIDIVPTIVDVMGIDLDWTFDGESLLDLDQVRSHQPIRWCCNGDGVETDLDVLLEQVAYNHSMIPDQSSWRSVVAVGAGADKVGHDLADLDVSADSSFTYSIDLGSTLDSVDVESGNVQTLVTGRVAGDVGDTLIVTLNDTVAGVAYVNRDSADGGSFIGLLGEDWVDQGRNVVRLFSVEEGGGLAPGTPDELDFLLITPDGREIDLVTEGRLRVQVDDVVRGVDGVSLTGWGANTTEKVPAEMIYVFIGSDLVAATEPNRDNRNVVAWFDSEDLRRSGFAITIPDSAIPAGVERILVVADFGDKAVADTVAINAVAGG